MRDPLKELEATKLSLKASRDLCVFWMLKVRRYEWSKALESELQESAELYNGAVAERDAALAQIEALQKERDRDCAGMREFQAKFIAADHEARALRAQVADLRKLLERARDHMTGDGFAFDVKQEIDAALS